MTVDTIDDFKVPEISFDDDGQPRLDAVAGWQFAVTGCVIAMSEGDFSIAVQCGCFDTGSEVVATFTCAGSPEVTIAKQIIGADDDFEGAINLAIRECCKVALVDTGYGWRLTDSAGTPW